jgi:hypothetical protein
LFVLVHFQFDGMASRDSLATTDAAEHVAYLAPAFFSTMNCIP